ncbi:MAG: response regulator transcription factor [Clostridia bacterium]|nr:response regulator transcription factor [Clostridia bacterium]
MMTVAVCDDSRYAVFFAEELRFLAEEAGVDVSVDVFKSYSYLQTAMKSKKYDLLLLETVIRGVSGIDFARNLRLSHCEADIIFVSASAEHALPAYSVFPIGYILKPFQRRRLRAPFRRAAEKYVKKPTLILRGMNGEKITVSLEDLLYIEVIGNELDIHCRTGVSKCVGSLSETYLDLPQKQFYRSHRSFIVNLNYVVRAAKYYFVMDNGDKVTIAKNRYAEAKSILTDFVG